MGISIHALRKESDVFAQVQIAATTTFQSTLSVRRATKGRPLEDLQKAISIHALRKESDRPTAATQGHGTDFNPRSP